MCFKWVLFVYSITVFSIEGAPREYDLKEVLAALKELSSNDNVEITVDKATIQSFGNTMIPRSDSTVHTSQSMYNPNSSNGQGYQQYREDFGGSTSYTEASSQPRDTWDYNRSPTSSPPNNWHHPPPPPPHWDHHPPPPPPQWDHHPPPPPPWDHRPPPPPPWDHRPPPPPPWGHRPPPEYERSNDYSYRSTERGRRDDGQPSPPPDRRYDNYYDRPPPPPPHHGPPPPPPHHGPPPPPPPPPHYGPPPPRHGPPGHGPPGHGPPGHGPPGHGPPGHGPPGHGPPGHGPQDHGPPGHRPPGRGPPDHGPTEERPYGPPPPQEPQRPSPQYNELNQQNQNIQRPSSSEWQSPSSSNSQPMTSEQYDIDVRKIKPRHPFKQTTSNDAQLQDTLKQIFGEQKENTVDFSVAKPAREANDIIPLSLNPGGSNQQLTPQKTAHFFQLQPVTPEE